MINEFKPMRFSVNSPVGPFTSRMQALVQRRYLQEIDLIGPLSHEEAREYWRKNGDCNISTRAMNVLILIGVGDPSQLSGYDNDDLYRGFMQLPNCGKLTAREVVGIVDRCRKKSDS